MAGWSKGKRIDPATNKREPKEVNVLAEKQKVVLYKRVADVSEKFAVASFALAAYEENMLAGIVGLVFLIACLIITARGEK